MERVAEIENAIIQNIYAARLPYLRYVGSYGGELAGDWKDVVRRLPAVWVVYKGADAPRPMDTAKTRWRGKYTYSTIVACRSVRSEAATRHGAESCPGTYQMLDDVHRLVCMQDFGLAGVDYLQPGRVRQLYNAEVQGQAISVYAQDWTCVVDYRLREPGQSPPGHVGTGYLPPDGTDYPGAANAGNPAPLADVRTAALRYWLKPPQDVETDPPMAEDVLELNITV